VKQLSKQEKEEFLSILDRMDDAKIRYFFLMMGSAIADYCDRQKSATPRRKAAAE
jgi:thioredoxin-related protein